MGSLERAPIEGETDAYELRVVRNRELRLAMIGFDESCLNFESLV